MTNKPRRFKSDEEWERFETEQHRDLTLRQVILRVIPILILSGAVTAWLILVELPRWL